MQIKIKKHLEDVIKNKLRWRSGVSINRITPLTEGGSERNFYRVEMDGVRTFVYMNYSEEKDENKYWYNIAMFFKKLKINIPDVYFNENGNIFIEDLGSVHLYNLVKSIPEKNILKYYYNAVDQLLNLYLLGRKLYERKPFKISNAFTYSLYRWESSYFLNNLIGNYFNIKINAVLNKKLEEDFNLLADRLSKEHTVLVHRDCQSKNIMIKDDQPYFIDFQGLRFGLPQYDLASLLEDPYVDLTENAKKDLLNYYIKKTSVRDYGHFIRLYQYCAIQRLMQALGAYSFLGIKKGKEEFFQYIPNGLKKLRLILGMQDGLNGLKDLLNTISPRGVRIV